VVLAIFRDAEYSIMSISTRSKVDAITHFKYPSSHPAASIVGSYLSKMAMTLSDISE
jgi:hypothetical protein